MRLCPVTRRYHWGWLRRYEAASITSPIRTWNLSPIVMTEQSMYMTETAGDLDLRYLAVARVS